MNLTRTKLVLLVLFCFTMISFVSADSNFRIQAVDEPFSMNKTGVNSSTIQLVKIEYANPEDSSWEPINQEVLEDNTQLTYYYNSSEGNASELNYLGRNYNGSGYWYAKFEPNQTRGNMVKYNASGSVNHSEQTDVFADETANLTEDLQVGDIEVRINNQIDDVYKAGKSINVQVKAWNTNEDNYFNDSEGSVEVSFANASGEATSTQLDNYKDDDDYFHNSEVDIPESTNSTYLMNIDVTPDSGSEPYGTFSKIIKTHPALRGEISYLNSENGCTNEDYTGVDFSVYCEQGAEVSAEYEITADSANQVNLTTYAFNNSGREELSHVSLERSDDNNDLFAGSADIPDLNSTIYGQNTGVNSVEYSKVEFVFNSSNGDRNYIDRKNVTIIPFTFEDRSSPTAFLGEQYNLKLFMGKPFSNEAYSLSRFDNISLNVTNPSGDRVAYFNKSNLSYKSASGLTRGSFTLDSDMESGPYDIEGEAYNVYGDKRTLDESAGFNAKDVNATFSIDDSEFDINTLWSENYTIDIDNLVSQENNLTMTNDLPDEIDLLNESVDLESDEEDFLKFEVNLTSMEDATGELILSDNDTGYNRTVEISANAADCKHISGRLCRLTESPVDAFISNSSNSVVKTVDILNVGPLGEELEVSSSVNGNISNHLSLVGDSDFNVSSDRTLSLNFTAGGRGNFTGDLSLDTDSGNLQINTSLDASITQTEDEQDEEDQEPVLSVDPESVDLGYLPEGDSSSATVELKNEGEETLSDISASSDTYTVSVSNSEDLEAGESLNITLEFEEVESESGDVAISAGENEVTVSVSAEPVPDYSGRAENDLRNRLQDLQEEDTNTAQDEDLTGVSTKIEKIKSAWDEGNYEEAQSLYNEADGTLQTVSNELESDGSDSSNNEGGIPIIPVAGGIFAFLIIFFVILTSYVPEEGDPLYGLLGG